MNFLPLGSTVRRNRTGARRTPRVSFCPSPAVAAGHPGDGPALVPNPFTNDTPELFAGVGASTKCVCKLDLWLNVIGRAVCMRACIHSRTSTSITHRNIQDVHFTCMYEYTPIHAHTRHMRKVGGCATHKNFVLGVTKVCISGFRDSPPLFYTLLMNILGQIDPMFIKWLKMTSPSLLLRG